MKRAEGIKLNRTEDLECLLRLLSNTELPNTERFAKRLAHAAMSFDVQQCWNKDIKSTCSECKGFCCIDGNHLHIADVLVLYYSHQALYIPSFKPMEETELDNCQYLTGEGCSATWKPMICSAFFCNRLGKEHSVFARLGASLRAAMEALVKIFKFETGEINYLSIEEQAAFIEDFSRAVFEAENNEE